MAVAKGMTVPERKHFFSVLENLGIRALLEKKLLTGYLVTLEEAIGTSKEQHVTEARAELMAYFYAHRWSHVAIGKLFGRDPTSVLHALAGRRRRKSPVDEGNEGR